MEGLDWSCSHVGIGGEEEVEDSMESFVFVLNRGWCDLELRA